MTGLFSCSSLIPRSVAAILALSALSACASSKSIGASVDDFNASNTIKRVLISDRTYDYSDIDLTLYEGRLLLTGTMLSDEGRKQLIANAWRAENVRQVIDEIIISDKTKFRQGVVDSRIDQAINAKLLSDRGVSSANYKVAVSSGIVYLIGVARDQLELDRALNHARSTAGVKLVRSHVLYKDDPARKTSSR